MPTVPAPSAIGAPRVPATSTDPVRPSATRPPPTRVAPASSFEPAAPRPATVLQPTGPSRVVPASAWGITGADEPITARAEPRLAIPDRDSVTTTLRLDDAATVGALSLDLDILHTYRGDLRVTLTSPSGTSHVVHDKSGGGADDLRGRFDLSAFGGEPVRGEWTLKVEDLLGGDVGTLQSWGLHITPQDAPPTRPASNDFSSRISGRHPPVAAGSFLTQLKQSAALAKLTLAAAQSVRSGGSNPTDFEVQARLRGLGTLPLTGDSGSVTRHDFFSTLEGVAPEAAYQHFVENPEAIFGAGGLKVRPAPERLENGMRLMLEDAGTPPIWFPIEVRLDSARNRIEIVTLDGHPLRGTNSFQFAADGKGGTRVSQFTAYQLSSKAVQLGMGEDELQRQHDTWESAHRALFEHFHPEPA